MYCIDLSYVFMAYVYVVLVLGRKDLRERKKYKLLFLQSFLNYIFEYWKMRRYCDVDITEAACL